jgi:hypothetical protein
MPAKDIFHENVKHALKKDHWIITHDQYWIKLVDNDINVYVDLAAERIIAAEKDEVKIAVEIKSVVGTSMMTDFHQALGQFWDYRVALRFNNLSDNYILPFLPTCTRHFSENPSSKRSVKNIISP